MVSNSGSGGSVLFEKRGAVAILTMNRPRYRNAQHTAMTYALDDAFMKAAHDDSVKVIVLTGSGDHFSSGHDLGTPDVAEGMPFAPRSAWWGDADKPGVEGRLAREEEIYLGMCRRWREIPKPTIAMVRGACIAGGLMLAWACDLIVASEDAYFLDPVIDLGIPGVEYFAHPWEFGSRQAKEFLFMAEPVSAERAFSLGMVNRVVSGDRLEAETMEMAEAIAERDRLSLALVKKAVNMAEDAGGRRSGMDAAFMIHQLAHSHWSELTGDIVNNRHVRKDGNASRSQ